MQQNIRAWPLYALKGRHHVNLNLTRTTLWNHFAKRNADPAAANRMMSVVSTLGGFHGHVENDSDVPRGKLVRALKDDTDLGNTEDLPSSPSWYELVIPLGSIRVGRVPTPVGNRRTPDRSDLDPQAGRDRRKNGLDSGLAVSGGGPAPTPPGS